MYARYYYLTDMLTKTEKRFVRNWEEQRTGGRIAYLLQYSLVGTIMLSLFTFVFLFFGLHVLFSWLLLVFVMSTALIVSFVAAIIVWQANERRWKALIRREINNAINRDNSAQS